MYFFHNLSHDEITFLIHEFTQDDASICFMRLNDTLLSIDFSSYRGGITINQNISGTNLSNPPFFKLDTYSISKIIVKYRKDILHLQFIHDLNSKLNSNKKFSVKNFNHNLVVSIGLRMSVLNSIVDLNSTIYNDFINDCINLTSFKKIEPTLRTKNLIKIKICRYLIRKIS